MLSALFYDAPIFNEDAVEVILECALDDLKQCMNNKALDGVSYNAIRRAILMQMEMVLEEPVNNMWPVQQKLSERC